MSEWIAVPVTEDKNRRELLQYARRDELCRLGRKKQVEVKMNSAKPGDSVNPFVVVARVDGIQFPISINFLGKLDSTQKRLLGITSHASEQRA